LILPINYLLPILDSNRSGLSQLMWM